MHEHFAFGYPGYNGDSIYSDQFEEALNNSISVAEKILKSGISSVVDATPNDCGRDPALLKKVSEATGLNIIASSGYYYQGEGAPAYFLTRNALGGNRDEDIYEIFKTEFTKGIGKTGIKPGVIKLATSKNIITEYEECFFKAAAKVSIEENISIITHTQEGTQGLEQADLLLSAGVDPVRVMIGHSCCNTDMDYLMSIAEKGVFIGLDRWGLQGGWGCPYDSRRIANLLGLIGVGYADKILISQDTVNFWWGRPVALGSVTDTWHPTHLVDNIVPILKKAGVSDSVLNQIFIDNPIRFFSGSR
ncbi:MAG: phosphotriesterase-related protein [Peptococcaceae bacterium]|nr:phosphotriesterase-related protein [Peptococcaceae bacterium]